MPLNDDAARRTARERSQARVNRYGGSSSYAENTDTYGRARQESAHLSQTRYSRQAPRQASQSSREQEQSRRSRQGASSQRRNPGSQGSRGARDPRSSGANRGYRQPSRADQGSRRQPERGGKRQPQRQASSPIASVLDKLPGNVVSIGIAVIGILVVLALIFGVLAPSCSRSDEAAPQSSESSAAASAQGIVSTAAQAKKKAQTAVETANQVGSLETSNPTVEALVSLLGEEEAAKLISQAKTNPDALWIAAHVDEYAFDGIEIQYKILKLAADEPAAIPYVRGFPAMYPMNDAVTDRDLAMDVASPSDSVPTTSIPHLYQWDRQWAYTVYSSASFGLTGCGPTSLAMVYQGLNKTVDRTPHDIAVLAEENGYMSEFNGTDSAFFENMAGDLGLNCWESYPDADNIREELSAGHVIIANLGPGYFTTNGHFFVLAGLTSDGQVIVNDPYSVIRSSQTWDPEFIATETMAMFVYSKA